MARVIQFHAPNTPSFSEANDLTRLSMEYANNAIKDVKNTWDTAVQNVRDKNHAEMKQAIDGYTYEQLQDSVVRNQIQEDIKHIGLPTGNIYDPTVVQTYLDTRGDTLLTRMGNDLKHQESSFNYDSKVLDDKVNKASVAVDNLRGQLRLTKSPEDVAHNKIILSKVNDVIAQAQFGDNLAYAQGAIANYTTDRANKELEQTLKQRATQADINKTNSQTAIANLSAPYQIREIQAGIDNTIAKTEATNVNTGLAIQGANAKQAQAQQEIQKAVVNAKRNELKQVGLPDSFIKDDGSFDLIGAKTSLKNIVASNTTEHNALKSDTGNKQTIAEFMTSKNGVEYLESLGGYKDIALDAILQLKDPNKTNGKPITDDEAISLLTQVAQNKASWFSSDKADTENLKKRGMNYINGLRKLSQDSYLTKKQTEVSNYIRQLLRFTNTGGIAGLAELGIRKGDDIYQYLDKDLKTQYDTYLKSKELKNQSKKK